MRQRHSSFFSIVVIATALVVAFPSHARIGVTSGTEGDPTGKPPVDAERILRVGIDIQADEMITTRQDDRAHVVFLDGTSLTVAPNAQIKIDKFVYDPDTKAGDIAISVVTGIFRMVGGKISKSRAITVTTPSAVIGVRGGIALFDVSGRETRAQFLFGKSMVVSAQGRSETASRAGSEIVTRFGAFPGNPGLIPAGGLALTLGLLDGRPRSGKGDETPDNRARQSGFSDQNSGKGVSPPHNVTLAPPGVATDAVSNAGIQKSQPAPAVSPPVVTALIPPPVVIPPPPPPSMQYDSWRRNEHRDFRHHRFDRH